MSNNSESSCEMIFGCEWMMNMCMESSESEVNTPHFIVMDEILGYNDNDVVRCRDSFVDSIKNESGRLPVELEGDDV